MFISSYNTYISNINTETKNTKKRVSEFSLEKYKSIKSNISTKTEKTLPLNYISRFKVLKNQQKLYEQTPEHTKSKFSKINTLKNAQNAYNENSSNFPTLTKSKIVIGLVKSKLPKTIKTKLNAVNVYVENDKYYKAIA